MTGTQPIIDYLKKHSGYSYDTAVPEELFERCRDSLEETERTRVTKYFPEASSYRDERRRKSVHLTDYRGLERDRMESDLVVAHLEHFNPEYHPVLHTLIDFPLWYIRNRIIERNRK
ncbi:hypothetical protein ACK3SF_03855 [Candidatus Nanosalina sp. VS9-1]|uniref:hypothetical protein n=1 Tax=Candidatus Nanosalina sp. VS9-1 TaxID=3388566 RepID=UPI0039DF715A